ncbi:hypothetical protein BC828DRAFT_375537 [Blastocladiella britannica]|nr:hypothetical protein BC828DRAFT_375537 [Blastocladiella britannica]
MPANYVVAAFQSTSGSGSPQSEFRASTSQASTRSKKHGRGGRRRSSPGLLSKPIRIAMSFSLGLAIATGLHFLGAFPLEWSILIGVFCAMGTLSALSFVNECCESAQRKRGRSRSGKHDHAESGTRSGGGDASSVILRTRTRSTFSNASVAVAAAAKGASSPEATAAAPAWQPISGSESNTSTIGSSATQDPLATTGQQHPVPSSSSTTEHLYDPTAVPPTNTPFPSQPRFSSSHMHSLHPELFAHAIDENPNTLPRPPHYDSLPTTFTSDNENPIDASEAHGQANANSMSLPVRYPSPPAVTAVTADPVPGTVGDTGREISSNTVHSQPADEASNSSSNSGGSRGRTTANARSPNMRTSRGSISVIPTGDKSYPPSRAYRTSIDMTNGHGGVMPFGSQRDTARSDLVLVSAGDRAYALPAKLVHAASGSDGSPSTSGSTGSTSSSSGMPTSSATSSTSQFSGSTGSSKYLAVPGQSRRSLTALSSNSLLGGITDLFYPVVGQKVPSLKNVSDPTTGAGIVSLGKFSGIELSISDEPQPATRTSAISSTTSVSGVPPGGESATRQRRSSTQSGGTLADLRQRLACAMESVAAGNDGSGKGVLIPPTVSASTASRLKSLFIERMPPTPPASQPPDG